MRVSTGIGNVEDIVYCQVTGENRIAVPGDRHVGERVGVQQRDRVRLLSFIRPTGVMLTA